MLGNPFYATSIRVLLLGSVIVLTACSSTAHFDSPRLSNSKSPLPECSNLSRGENCYFVNAPIKLEPSKKDLFRVTEALYFVDSKGKPWSAPANTITDGASIPALFVPIFGARTSPQFINAAAVHDAYCAQTNAHLPQHFSESWEDVHRMFYEALLANGTSEIKAKIMYAAVYLGGPRWNDNERSLASVSDEHLVQELKWCKKWIEKANPSRHRIEQWMQSRESNLQQGSPQEPNWEKLLAER